MTQDNMTYEQSLERLKALADQIRSKDLSLEDSIRCYEEGMACYEQCRTILKESKAKIDVYEGEER